MASSNSPIDDSDPLSRPLSWRLDGGIALVLVLGTFFTLFFTNDVGFPRDEGFYFRHAVNYQNWFYDVELGSSQDENPALSREGVSRAWRANAEHPPLMKVLFGASWRSLARKVRPVGSVKEEGSETIIVVRNIQRSEGFHPGAKIKLLKPQKGAGSGEIEDRVIGLAEVVEMGGGKALARVIEGSLNQKSYASLCTSKPETGGVPDVFSGCQAVPENAANGMSESKAFRLPTMILGALLIGAIYLFGVGFLSRWASLFSSLAFFFVPRHFFHAHMTAFDMPVTAFIFFTVVAFWFSLRSRRWAWICGVLWGVAILAKHNAFFLPVIFVFWWLTGARISLNEITKIPDRFRSVGLPLGVLGLMGIGWIAGGIYLAVSLLIVLAGLAWLGGQLRLPPMPLSFLTMLLVGLPMFFLLWPRMWFDTYANFRWYLEFHLEHEHYMQVYFGDVLAYPPFPWGFPFVMTLLTVPLVTLALACAGSASWLIPWVRSKWTDLRRREPLRSGPRPWGLGALLGIHALYPILLIAMPSTPVFGGTKHWLPAMPFVCLLAGVGFDRMVVALSHLCRVRGVRWRHAIAGGLVILCLAPSVSATLHIHPHGTAYYNSLAGGISGASDMGMQRQFWGYSTRQGLDYLNENVPYGKTVYFHKCTRTAWDLYRKEGLIREDIKHIADIFDLDRLEQRLKRTSHAVFHHQKDHDEYEVVIWRSYGTHMPVHQVVVDGVPMLSIYKNPRQK